MEGLDKGHIRQEEDSVLVAVVIAVVPTMIAQAFIRPIGCIVAIIDRLHTGVKQARKDKVVQPPGRRQSAVYERR